MSTYIALSALLAACGAGGGTATPDSGHLDDTGPEPVDDGWFQQAVLDPPFAHVNATWAGVALADFDGDGWTDIFLPNGRNAPDALYRNLGDGRFVDVAAEVGLGSLAENGAAVAADLDNDGDQDLVVNTTCSTGTWDPHGNSLFDGGKLLYLNQGDGRFVETPFALPDEHAHLLATCTVSLGVADVDNDGDLDLLLANGHDLDVTPPWIFDKRDPGAATAILYNDGSAGFHDAWVTDSPVTSFVTAVADLDRDGVLDVLVGEGGDPVTRILLDQPTPRPHTLGTDSGRGLWMGLALADYDRDGDLDLYATNQGLSPYLRGYDNTGGFYPTSQVEYTDPDQGVLLLAELPLHPLHAVLENVDGQLGAPADWGLQAQHALAGDDFEGMNGQYLEWAHPDGLGRLAWAWGAVAADVDADGWMDVLFTGNNGSAPLDIIDDEAHAAGPGALLRNTGDRGFEDLTWTAGIANTDADGRYQDGRGIAVGDLNNDGYVDFVVANRTTNPSLSDPLAQRAGVPHVWLSRPRDGHWLHILVEGRTSNRDAVGAEVVVRNGDDALVLPVGAGGGTCSSSEKRLTVGLGDWTHVDVEVRFPSGRVQVVQDVAADQDLHIVEDAT